MFFFFFSVDCTIKAYILFKEKKKKKKRERERRTEGIKEVRLWKKKKEV